MIETGIDGLSRGSLTEGVMAGIPYLDFFPLNKTAFERSPQLLDDFKDMIPIEDVMVLKLRDWFEKGHDIHGWTKNKRGLTSQEHIFGNQLQQLQSMLLKKCAKPG
jgi:hypothetical protein